MRPENLTKPDIFPTRRQTRSITIHNGLGLAPGPDRRAVEEYGRLDKYYPSVILPSVHIILENAPSPSPHRMGRDRGGAFHLPTVSPSRVTSLQPIREERGLIDEMANLERIESDIDRLIERRADGTNRANAEAAAERAQAEGRNRRYREAVLRQKLEFHRGQLEAHTRTFSRLIDRHKGALRLCEEALGITTDEGEDAA